MAGSTVSTSPLHHTAVKGLFTGQYLSAMIRIAVVGPESTGKTTLVEALADHYGCVYTQEYARVYLEQDGPGYAEEDLVSIASGQLMVEAEAQKLAAGTGRPLIICDTDMLTVRIWSEEKFGRARPLLEQLARDVAYDHWLLCRPDIPWEPDPLRENPHDRDRLFAVYEDALRRLERPYTIIEGEREQRLAAARVTIVPLLRKEKLG